MYKKISEGWRKHLDFIILDILCLHISFILACKIRNISGNPYQSSNYFNVLVVLTLLSVVVIIFCDSLKNVLKRGFAQLFDFNKHSVIISAAALKQRDLVRVRLQDGEAILSVKEVWLNNDQQG